MYSENHPLGIVFDEEGVCSGCRVHEEKDSLDWGARNEKLRGILNGFRSTSRNIHDCVVPVSGARDSYWIVHQLKHEFGMHPLLVSYNKQYNTQLGWRNLGYLRTLLGCDFMVQTVSPERVRRITRESIRLMGSVYWHCLAGQTVFPVQIAARFKIPLVIWGHHQGLDQVGMFSHTDEVEMTRKYREEHDLMGFEAEDLAARSELLSEEDLEPYVYPHDRELEVVGVRGLYLGNYLRWDTKAQHEEMILRYGYETADLPATFDRYNDVDCWVHSDLHDWSKRLKWGYGRVTDHACREIRLRRMTREQGIEAVARQGNPEPRHLGMFLEWLDLSEAEFREEMEAHRNPDVWIRNGAGWVLKDSVTHHIDDSGVDAARLPAREDRCKFTLSPSRDPQNPDDRYILIGRGWVDTRPG